MTLALPHPMTIKPEDFEPPLKRKEPSVPYYWTVEELAEELGVTTRYVQYLIRRVIFFGGDVSFVLNK